MELFRALAVLSEPPTASHARIAAVLDLPPPPDEAAYNDLFLFQLPPYASVYVGPEGLIGGEARERIAGFFRALQLNVPSEPDHLVMLLGAYASLAENEMQERDAPRALLWQSARKALLWEHLLPWLPMYLGKLRRLATGCYHAWATLLIDALAAEAETLGRQETLPLHLREAPALASPDDIGADAFIVGLLTPVSSGIILTRHDLASAGEQVDVGIRPGERRAAIKALLAHDAVRTLEWLRAQAEDWRTLHAAQTPRLGAVAEFWTARANSTAALLHRLTLQIRSSHA